MEWRRRRGYPTQKPVLWMGLDKSGDRVQGLSRDHAVGRSLATDDRPPAGFLRWHTTGSRTHEENCPQLLLAQPFSRKSIWRLKRSTRSVTTLIFWPSSRRRFERRPTRAVPALFS